MNRKLINIPYLSFSTHCIVYGDITKGTPIIVLHGGPGGCVERYEPLTELVKEGIPLIFYDQLGCGYSKVPKGNDALWTFETYLNELENVIKYFNLQKYIILGHSWGGMLALEWITTREHKGLQKLILFSTLPSTKIWNDEHMKMIENYPENEKNAILNDLHGSNTDNAALKAGLKRFYKDHVSKKSDKKYPFKTKRFPKINKEIYEKMWGKSELFGTGTLSSYNTENKLENIDVNTLIISGKYDESTPVMNELMSKNIKNSKWVLLKHSHHCGYFEEPELVIKTISNFVLND